MNRKVCIARKIGDQRLVLEGHAKRTSHKYPASTIEMSKLVEVIKYKRQRKNKYYLKYAKKKNP